MKYAIIGDMPAPTYFNIDEYTGHLSVKANLKGDAAFTYQVGGLFLLIEVWRRLISVISNNHRDVLFINVMDVSVDTCVLIHAHAVRTCARARAHTHTHTPTHTRTRTHRHKHRHKNTHTSQNTFIETLVCRSMLLLLPNHL